MNVLNQIRDSGWGAVFLFLYGVGVFYQLFPELNSVFIMVAAAVPAIFVIYLSIVFNDELMELLAGETIRRTLGEIKQQTGEDEFYWAADGDIQERIDEMDQKAHQQAVTILTGGIIGLSLPVFLWQEFGLRGVLAGSAGALLVGYLLSYRAYRQLQEIIKSSVKPYEAEYED